MKKHLFYILFISIAIRPLFALENDSIKTIELNRVEVYSAKETNQQNTPVSSTLLNAAKIEQSQITSIKDVSVKVPNFFIPDYGSAMSSTPYVRGVGSRYSGQSISLYLDNVPYLEKTAFDFELYDIAQIEVLRGPQGTLYGRNSIGGIVNIYTLSPLNFQGTRAELTAGNYGLIHAKASHYAKIGEKVGISVGGYYGQQSGFYPNDFTGKNVDDEKTAGARAKLAWDVSRNFKLDYAFDFDFVDQGAFPYGLYNAENKTVANPNFNDLSRYSRKTLNNSISTKYFYEDIILSVSLAHQYFNDKMNIDQDFLPESIFTLEQVQNQNLLNGEAVIKSISNEKYKWLVGVNSFVQQLDLEAPVSFKEDGIKKYLQPQLPQGMTIKNTTYDIPGTYDYSRTGGALFHQSTFDNLFVKGLSLTLGARLDIEKALLDYNTSSEMTMEMARGPQVISMTSKAQLEGKMDTTFVAFLPKAALKYEWAISNYVYLSASRGYKTGGYNIQMISDLLTEKLRARPGTPEPNVKQSTLYLPERSWNYELGIQKTFLERKLKTNLTLFYMDISGLQLTEFVQTGAGRKLTNAGTSASKGVELAADMNIGGGFNAGVTYGYANASFKHFTQIENVQGQSVEVDYAGKFVPYAPQNTMNVYLNYLKNFDNSFISQLYGTISYSGIGKIYWQESNETVQDFYSLIDAKLGVKKDAFGVEIWGKNLLNTNYNAFYFESFGNKFFQKGKPLQFGARLTMDL